MAEMSFLPEDYLDRRAQRRTNVICVSLFVVVMSAVIGAYLVSDQQRTDVRRHREIVNARFTEAARRLEQLDELHKRKTQMLKKAKVTGSLVEKLPRSLILSQLVNAMPTTLSLVEVELESTVLKPTASQAKTSLEKAKTDAKTKKSASKKGEPAPEPEIDVKPVQIKLIVTGYAKTDVEVSEFMKDIKAIGKPLEGDQPGLFSNINLSFAEEVKLEEVPMRKFKVEIIVNQNIDFREFEPVMVKRELKQNPMGNTVNIDENGQVVPRAPRTDLLNNVSDTARRSLNKD